MEATTRDAAHNAVAELLDAIHRGGDAPPSEDEAHSCWRRLQALAPVAADRLWRWDTRPFYRRAEKGWKDELKDICATAAAEISEGGSIADYGF